MLGETVRDTQGDTSEAQGLKAPRKKQGDVAASAHLSFVAANTETLHMAKSSLQQVLLPSQPPLGNSSSLTGTATAENTPGKNNSRAGGGRVVLS